MVTNAEIIRFLKSKSIAGSFVDGLKIRYRPLVCPFQALFAFVQPGDKVVDIGCGSGQFCLLLNKFTPVGSLYGIEITERLISNAKTLFASEAGAKPHAFEVYNGTDFPARVGEGNLVYLIDVLHHVPKPLQEKFIYNLYAAMAPGAKLILKDINRASPLVIFNKIHDLVFSGEIGNEKSISETAEICKKAGFGILSTFTKRTAVYPHYFLVLEKAL